MFPMKTLPRHTGQPSLLFLLPHIAGQDGGNFNLIQTHE